MRAERAHKGEGEEHLGDEQREREFELIVIEDRLVKQRDRDGHHPIRCGAKEAVEFVVRDAPTLPLGRHLRRRRVYAEAVNS